MIAATRCFSNVYVRVLFSEWVITRSVVIFHGKDYLKHKEINRYEGFCLHTHFCRTKYTFSRNLFTVCAGTDWAADSRDKNKTDPSLRLPAVPAPSVAVCLFNTGRGPMVNNTRPGGTDPTKRWSGHWTDFLLTVVIVIKAFYNRALITKSWIMWRGWCF